jgi:hypothetical protein
VGDLHNYPDIRRKPGCLAFLLGGLVGGMVFAAGWAVILAIMISGSHMHGIPTGGLGVEVIVAGIVGAPVGAGIVLLHWKIRQT